MDRSPAVPDRTVHSHERLLEIWSIGKKAVRLGRPFNRPFNRPFSTSTSNFITHSNSGFIKAVFGCHRMKAGNRKIINGQQMKSDWLQDI